MAVPSTEQIAARWSSYAEYYDHLAAHGHPAYRRAWVDALAELVGFPHCDGSAPLRIADVGIGTAEIALLLAEMGHDVTGYDIAPGMLEVARKNVDAAGVAMRFAHGDAYHLPLDEGSVDVVINRMVFWTLYDPPRALVEWRRVLAPGGRIIVIDAVYFATPRNALQRVRKVLRERIVRGALRWLRRIRDQLRTGHRDVQRRHDRADTVQPPGKSWQDRADALRYFTDAGLNDVTTGWLRTVADVDRRTAPLRSRITGLLPPFFTLSWRKPF